LLAGRTHRAAAVAHLCITDSRLDKLLASPK
jgi:hypothetical protein